MRDQMIDLFDRMPRWGELSRSQRLLAAGATVAIIVVIVVTAVWAAGTFGGEEKPPAAATGPAIEPGFATCSRTASDRSDPAVVAATIGDMSGLPYQANFVEATSTPGDNGQIVVAVVCMRPDATIDQLKDVATILAQNIKSDTTVASQIDMFGVVNIGDGDDTNGEVHTDFRVHPFASSQGVYSQRGVWEVVPVN